MRGNGGSLPGFGSSGSSDRAMIEPAIPARIGPAEFTALGGMIAVRCPSDLDPWMRKAGGLWEPERRRWLIERWRINPLIRNLRRATDPLFRQAGIDLDER
jgi:hypothetical protein